MKSHCELSHKNESLTSVTTSTGEILQVPIDHLAQTTVTSSSYKTTVTTSSYNKSLVNNSNSSAINTSSKITNVPLSSSNNSTIVTSSNQCVYTQPTITANSSTTPSCPITITGQIIKGGNNNSNKVTTTISSLNLSNLVAASGGKIALKALPTGQLLLSQPLDRKLTALVKQENNNRIESDDKNGTGLIQLKSESCPQIDLGKLLQLHSKSNNQHQLAVTTSTISVAIPAKALNTLKASQNSLNSTTPLIGKAVKTPIISGLMNTSNTNSIKDSEADRIGKGVILGVTMEEGTLLDNADGTLSELTVLD